jgi:hypothetical protein
MRPEIEVNIAYKGMGFRLPTAEELTTMEPRTIQPRDPPALALSSEYSCRVDIRFVSVGGPSEMLS